VAILSQGHRILEGELDLLKETVRRITLRGEKIDETFLVYRASVNLNNNLETDFLSSSVELPDFILDLFETAEETEIFVLAERLASCSSPKAQHLLEKWTHTENKTLKSWVMRYLKFWKTNQTIREQKKELFRKLVEEKLTPDDLLLPQNPWVWKNDQYVEVSSQLSVVIG
jgi:hypothetical protein